MAMKNDISAEYVRQLLDYDAIAGILTWKNREPQMFTPGFHSAETQCKAWNAKFAGAQAGHVSQNDGYLRLYIDNSPYLGHRIVWLIVYGTMPPYKLDHKNGVRSDIKFKNLRPATDAENGQNRKHHKNNTSGYSGVTWHKRAQKWYANISVRHNKIFLGSFETAQDASIAYLEAKKQLHEFQPVPRS